MDKLQPDLKQAEAFLHRLEPDGQHTFQTFGEGSRKGDKALQRVLHGTLQQHGKALVALNLQGAGVFVMVNAGNGIEHPGKTCRTKENVLRVRALFLDLDGAPIEPVLKAEAKPHILVQSSPGKWHAYWIVSDCLREEFTNKQKNIAARFNGDPKVSDLPRVMRLPGFYHHKDPAKPFMSQLMEGAKA